MILLNFTITILAVYGSHSVVHCIYWLLLMVAYFLRYFLKCVCLCLNLRVCSLEHSLCKSFTAENDSIQRGFMLVPARYLGHCQIRTRLNTTYDFKFYFQDTKIVWILFPMWWLLACSSAFSEKTFFCLSQNVDWEKFVSPHTF